MRRDVLDSLLTLMLTNHSALVLLLSLLSLCSWTPSAWSIGSATCGTCTQTRTLTCTDTTNSITTAHSYCGTPLALIQTCVVPHCVAWQTSAWSGGSVACGPGIQTRDVYCYDLTDGMTVEEGSCGAASGAGTKPLTQQAFSYGNCFAYV